MLSKLTPLSDLAVWPDIIITCRHELFEALSPNAQKHFVLQAVGGSIDETGYTTLGFELRRARDAAALATAIFLRTTGKILKKVPEPTNN